MTSPNAWSSTPVIVDGRSRSTGAARETGATGRRVVEPLRRDALGRRRRATDGGTTSTVTATMHPGAAAYGDAFADVYDEWYGELSDVPSVVAAVAAMARGPVLELGVGTGRLAVPLADRLADVHGMDASAAMLERLRANDPGGRVVPHLGDMAGPLPLGPWSVVFAAYNTFFNLDDERRQLECMRAVHAVLAADGAFVIEAFVPSTTPVPRRSVEVRRRQLGRRVLSVTVTDSDRQVARGALSSSTGPHHGAGAGASATPGRRSWTDSPPAPGWSSPSGGGTGTARRSTATSAT